MSGLRDRLQILIGRVIDGGQWLALPLIVLLFLQWPLREIFRAYSREANDLGQIVFALYVAISVTAATRAGTHLAADILAQRYSPRWRQRLHKAGMALALMPWAAFVIFSGAKIVIPSVAVWEAFPDTFNPGYFIIKIALWLMAALILLQAAVDITAPRSGSDV